jgi:hypothetical protein
LFTSKYPRVYFDLKAFRKGIAEKKQSLIEAEKRKIDRAYAKEPPQGWDIEKFLQQIKLADPGLSPEEAGTFYRKLRHALTIGGFSYRQLGRIYSEYPIV